MSTYTTPSGYVGHTVNRNCNGIKAPSAVLPDDAVVFPKRHCDIPDVDFLKAHFFEEGRLSTAQALRLVEAGRSLLAAESNLLMLQTPITIVGDIHGQYYDLLKMFQIAGDEPPRESFLFLGDYVDRGYFSIECFLYLLALKLNYPTKVHMLRGNHECRHLTRHFTFRLECHYKYTSDVYDAVMQAFDALPLAAVVNNQFFCAHGGISPHLKLLKDINSVHVNHVNRMTHLPIRALSRIVLDRFCEPPKTGLMCDLIWSDPTPNYGRDAASQETFTSNSSRGCSYRFSYRAVADFLERNKLLCVVRGHEAQDLGYRLYEKLPASDFPSLMTIFSAPNYVDVYKNKGAIVKYDGSTFNIRQFTHAPHPFYLPKFIDAFDWSLPFLSEKIADLLLLTLNIPTMTARLATLSDEERARIEQLRKFRDRVIKNKILAINQLGRMFHTVRNERETVDELMNIMGTRIVPHRYLTLGAQEIRTLVKTFSDAKRSDSINEMVPPSDEDTSNIDDACSVTSLTSLDEPLPIPEDEVTAKRAKTAQ